MLELTRTLDDMAILVVDDSPDTAEMLAFLLGSIGAQVTVATGGDEALSILATTRFDVVLSDISMPGMDGYQFLTKLRALPDHEDMPVLALSGFGRPEDIEQATEAGFSSHVTKPVDLDSLALLLTRLPKRTRRSRPK